MTVARLVSSLFLAGVLTAQGAAPLRFLHVSDTHLPMRASEEYVRELLDAASARDAAFSIHTGDITEFGGRRRAWPSYLALFHGADLPHFDALGNHDQTWDGLADRLRERFGAPYYRFERGGVTFFCLNSASYQDPRPSFGEEQLRWLAAELAGLRAGARVALFLHHPLGGKEFATPYEVQRLCAMLAGHHVLAIFVGHGHRARSGRIGAWRWVMGGSTFGGDQGHGVCTIGDDRVRYVYRFRDPERDARVLLDEPLGEFAPVALGLEVARDGEQLRARLTADGDAGGFDDVRMHVDFAGEAAARGALGDELTVGVAGLTPGVHVLTAIASHADGREHHEVHEFEVAAPASSTLRLAWTRRLPAALQGPMAASAGLLACCGNDGVLRAFDARSGAERWSVALDGPAPGGVAADGAGGFVAATLEGVVARVGGDGTRRWSRELGQPIAATPVVFGGRALCVDLDGRGHALDLETGQPRWQRVVAGYAIEKPPVALDDRRVVFGAWDTRIHAFDVANGDPSWSLRALGARGKAARYYSPADCSPAVVDGRVFVADRKFELTVTDLEGGELEGRSGVASVCAHPPSHAVLLRMTDGRVVCLDSRSLDVRWERALPVGRTPTPVTTDGEHVLVIGERDGVLHLLDAADGALLDRHRVNGGHYPFCPVLVVDGMAFAGGMDGRLRAFALGG